MIPLIDIPLSTVPSLYTLSTTTDPPSGAPDNPVIPPQNPPFPRCLVFKGNDL